MKRWWGVAFLLAWMLSAPGPVARAAEGDSETEGAERRALSAYAGAVRPIMVRVLAMVREAGERVADRMETLPEPQGGVEALVDGVLSEAGAEYRLALFNALLERLSALPVPATAQTVHEAILAGMYRAREVVEAPPAVTGMDAAVDAGAVAREVQTTFQQASSDLADRLARVAVAPLPVSVEPSVESSGLLDRLVAEPSQPSGETADQLGASSVAQ